MGWFGLIAAIAVGGAAARNFGLLMRLIGGVILLGVLLAYCAPEPARPAYGSRTWCWSAAKQALEDPVVICQDYQQ